MLTTLLVLSVLAAIVAAGTAWFLIELVRYVTTGQYELDERLRKVSH